MSAERLPIDDRGREEAPVAPCETPKPLIRLDPSPQRRFAKPSIDVTAAPHSPKRLDIKYPLRNTQDGDRGSVRLPWS